MAKYINGKRYFDPNDYIVHKGLQGNVSYHYGYAPDGQVRLPGNATHYTVDFEDFFQYSKDIFNSGYRVYMENLYKRSYGYSLANSDATGSVRKNITIQTSNMAHAFGLPSKSAELPLRNKYLTAFFDGIITQNGNDFVIKKDSNGKNSDFLGDISLDLKECSSEEYQQVKDYVDNTMQEVTARLTNVIQQSSTPTLQITDAMQVYENELMFISNIILDGVPDNEEFPGLRDLCNKYKDVKGLNAYLLDALLKCTEAYKEMLDYRNSFMFTYDLEHNVSNVGDLLIDWIVGDIIYSFKDNPENLKQYFNNCNSLNKFMDFIQPFVLKINIDYAPNANLSVINGVIENYYPAITAKIRDTMVQSYISTKDKDAIVADATWEDALNDPLLPQEIEVFEPSELFAQQIREDFKEYCTNNGLIVDGPKNYVESLLLFFGELSADNKWTLEHWKYLAAMYYTEKESIKDLKEKLTELVAAKEQRGKELLTIENAREVPIEDDVESLLFEDEIGFDILSEIDEIEALITNKESNVREYEELLGNEIVFYNKILVDREIANVSDLDAEINKFRSMATPKLKGNAKTFPILFAFFNGVGNSLPLYDNFDDFKIYGTRNKKGIDKLFQYAYDQLFEMEESLRSEIFIEDLENLINEAKTVFVEPIDKTDLINYVMQEMLKKYDFPYLYKKMIDSKYMIDSVFKDDFVNGRQTINYIRVAEKAKVLPRISHAFLQAPMIKRTDGKILTQFQNDGTGVKEKETATFVKSDQQMIGYFFQLPNSRDEADLVFVEPKRVGGNLEFDQNNNIVYVYTHFFRREPLSGPVTKVIAKQPDGTYDFDDYAIQPGSIVSFGTKIARSGRSRPITSFSKENFFPTNFDKYKDDKYGTGATIAAVSEDDKQLFEMMISSEQLAVSTHFAATRQLELTELQERIQNYEQANGFGLS